MAITLNAKAYSFAGFNARSMSVYKYTGGGFPSSFSYLTSKVDGEKKVNGNRQTRVDWRLSVPRVATEASSCACPGTVLGTDYLSVSADVSSITTGAERTDLWTRLRDLVASPEFKASIEGLTQSST